MIFHNDNSEITEPVVRHDARPKATHYNHMQSFSFLVRIDRTHRFFDGPRNVKIVRLVGTAFGRSVLALVTRGIGGPFSPGSHRDLQRERP